MVIYNRNGKKLLQGEGQVAIMAARGKGFRQKGGKKAKTGIILFQKYKLLERTGTGNGSEVYVAEHIKLHALRAVKCVEKEKVPYEKLVKEVVYLKSLIHPGIPVIYDLEEDEKYFYIIEEYVAGESLKSMLTRHKKFSLDEIAEYGIQLCEIVFYLHNQKPYPILHSDITPANIIVKNEKLKLVDFGNSVRITGKEQKEDVYGTMDYMSPEGSQETICNVRTDIYGVCSVLNVLYEEGVCKSKTTIKENKRMAQIRKIILKGISKEADKRYESIDELQIKLELWKKEKPENLTSPGKKESISITIGCGGITPSAGVTTLALAMTEVFGQEGKAALVELDGKNDLGKWKMWQEEHGRYLENIKYGFRCDDTDYYPNADNDTLLYVLNLGYQVVVMDFGNFKNGYEDDFKKCNKKVLLGNYCVWNYEQSLRKLEDMMDGMITKDWTYMTLCSDQGICTILENKLGIRIRKLHPFKNKSQQESMIKSIWNGKRKPKFSCKTLLNL